MTAYGHCYYSIIIQKILAAGVKNDQLHSALNFLTFIAYKIYFYNNQMKLTSTQFNYSVEQYKEKFVIIDQIINKLQRVDAVLVNNDGIRYFDWPYSYYYFLGKYMAENQEDNSVRNIIKFMINKSYLKENQFSLIFLSHHSTQINKLLGTLLSQTSEALNHIYPAKLYAADNLLMKNFIRNLSLKILDKSSSIREEREMDLDLKDKKEETEIRKYEANYDNNINNKEHQDIFIILQNIDILSLILKNSYGSFSKANIKLIIKTINESGLRVLKFFYQELSCDDNINLEFHSNKMFGYFVIILSFSIVETIVNSVGIKEIRALLADILNINPTPAHELIKFVSNLHSTDKWEEALRINLSRIIKSHKGNILVTSLISIFTQFYIKSHKIPPNIVQSVCSILKVKYTPRILRKVDDE